MTVPHSYGSKVEEIAQRFAPMTAIPTNEAVAQYNDLLDLARELAAVLDKPSSMEIKFCPACEKDWRDCSSGPSREPPEVQIVRDIDSRLGGGWCASLASHCRPEPSPTATQRYSEGQ